MNVPPRKESDHSFENRAVGIDASTVLVQEYLAYMAQVRPSNDQSREGNKQSVEATNFIGAPNLPGMVIVDSSLQRLRQDSSSGYSVDLYGRPALLLEKRAGAGLGKDLIARVACSRSETWPKYVAESISDADVGRLKELKKTKDQLIQVKMEINEKGRDPAAMVSDLMKNNRVVGLGEMHLGDNPMRRFGKEVIPQLKAAGATHLAIEVSDSLQPVIDKFMKTGQLDESKLPPGLRHEEYIDILKAARNAGLKIACVDDYRLSRRRDEFMADKINNILSENKDNKVIFWVGASHLSTRGDNKAARSAADYIREKHSIATVEGSDGCWASTTIGILTPDLITAVGISTKDAKRMGELERVPPSAGVVVPWRHDQWDNYIIFPAQQRIAL